MQRNKCLSQPITQVGSIELTLEFAGECICFPFKFPGEGVHENLDEIRGGRGARIVWRYCISARSWGSEGKRNTNLEKHKRDQGGRFRRDMLREIETPQ